MIDKHEDIDDFLKQVELCDKRDDVKASVTAPAGETSRAQSAPDSLIVDGVDLTSFGDVSLKTPPKSPRTGLLETALAEFQSLPPNEFLRGVELYGLDYVIVGTWTGIVRGQLARLNGAPGAEKSFVAARDTRLVVEDLREPTPDGEHRVWLVPRIPGLPLKVWLTIGDRNVPHYFVFTPGSWETVSEATYLATRAQRNWV